LQPVQSTIFLIYQSSDTPDATKGALYWCDADKAKELEESNRFRLPVDKITDIVIGDLKGPIPVNVQPERCLTIVSSDRVLNLSAHSSGQIQDWVSGLKQILQTHR